MFTRHFPHWPQGQPKTVEVPRHTVYRNLEAIVAQDPQRAAIDYYGRRLSYAELKDGHVVVPAAPGAGIKWNEKAVERYKI